MSMENKNKTIIVILFLFSFNLFSNTVSAGFSVEPIEISIDMKDEISNGNTSRKIVVKNNYDFKQNFSWYIIHPEPVKWMRPDKSKIPDLSWVTLKPEKITIDAYSTGKFYIHLYIPELKDYYDEQWETWIVIKPDENNQNLFKQEYAVRTYIKTPIQKTENNDIKSINTEDNTRVIVTFFSFSMVLILSIITLIIIFLHKKKTRK